MPLAARGLAALPVYQTVQIRTFYQLVKGSDLLFILYIPLKDQSKVVCPCSGLFPWHSVLFLCFYFIMEALYSLGVILLKRLKHFEKYCGLSKWSKSEIWEML